LAGTAGHRALGVADPASVTGSRERIERAFREALVTVDRRIGLFLSLSLVSLDQLAIKKKVEEIGRG
jgi:arsenate reductase